MIGSQHRSCGGSGSRPRKRKIEMAARLTAQVPIESSTARWLRRPDFGSRMSCIAAASGGGSRALLCDCCCLWCRRCRSSVVFFLESGWRRAAAGGMLKFFQFYLGMSKLRMPLLWRITENLSDIPKSDGIRKGT